MDKLNGIKLTDDTLENIMIMAPLLDEVGQNRVFGLMCGLLAPTSTPTEKTDTQTNVIA